MNKILSLLLVTAIAALMLRVLMPSIAWHTSDSAAQVRSVQAQEKIEREENWTTFTRDLERGTVQALRVFVFAIAGGAGVVLLVLYMRRVDSNYRQRDGSRPLIETRGADGMRWFTNPDTAETWGVHPVYGRTESTPNVPAELLPMALEHKHARIVGYQAVQREQAATPGDNVLASKFGSMALASRGGRGRNATQAKEDAGVFAAIADKERAKAEQAQRKLTDGRGGARVVDGEQRLREAPTLDEAFFHSTPEEWAIGFNRETGVALAFKPRQTIHALVAGGSGSGKTTNTGMMLPVHALRNGWHVAILDGAIGDEDEPWKPFQLVAEYYESDQWTIVDQLKGLEAEFQRREQGGKKTPALIVIEEYGDLYRQLSSADKTEAARIIDRVMSRGRSMRLHLELIDQAPVLLPEQVRLGIKGRYVYHLLEAGMLKEYKAHKLPERGWFLHNEQPFEGFHVAPEVHRLLPAPRGAVPRMLEGEYTVKQETGAERVSTSGERPVSMAHERPVSAIVSGNEHPVSGGMSAREQVQFFLNASLDHSGMSGRDIAAVCGVSVGLAFEERKKWREGQDAPDARDAPSGGITVEELNDFTAEEWVALRAAIDGTNVAVEVRP